MQLFSYYRSTSSYRVRIALALKGLDHQVIAVNLLAGEQHQPPYLARNSQGRVPLLRIDDGLDLPQSLAIIEYLEELQPLPALLPSDPVARARVRGVAAQIACDIHPLHNVSVLNRLRTMGQDEAQVQAWIAHWVGTGLAAVEPLLGEHGYCFGEEPGLADVFLIPQVYAAQRFAVDLSGCPRIARINALAAQHPAFLAAHPAQQADAPAQ